MLLIDNVYRDPMKVREMALGLPYAAGSQGFYPGRIARVEAGNSSLIAFLRTFLGLVNEQYLPLLPPPGSGRKFPPFRSVDTDFGIVDLLPGALGPAQRTPHTDPVPVFGLVYLNREERGGTLFFEPTGEGASPAPGYPGDEVAGYRLAGRIEGRFNRLAIYPGFVPHTGEIRGKWIEGEESIRHPRLTQRLLFTP